MSNKKKKENISMFKLVAKLLERNITFNSEEIFLSCYTNKFRFSQEELKKNIYKKKQYNIQMHVEVLTILVSKL